MSGMGWLRKNLGDRFKFLTRDEVPFRKQLDELARREEATGNEHMYYRTEHEFPPVYPEDGPDPVKEIVQGLHTSNEPNRVMPTTDLHNLMLGADSLSTIHNHPGTSVMPSIDDIKFMNYYGGTGGDSHLMGVTSPRNDAQMFMRSTDPTLGEEFHKNYRAHDLKSYGVFQNNYDLHRLAADAYSPHKTITREEANNLNYLLGPARFLSGLKEAPVKVGLHPGVDPSGRDLTDRLDWLMNKGSERGYWRSGGYV